jgi:hypothetical protein
MKNKERIYSANVQDHRSVTAGTPGAAETGVSPESEPSSQSASGAGFGESPCSR